jgi:hypothetical protein
MRHIQSLTENRSLPQPAQTPEDVFNFAQKLNLLVAVGEDFVDALNNLFGFAENPGLEKPGSAPG